MSRPLLQAAGLVKVFERAGRRTVAVDHVSFHLDKGHCLGIVGESGSGKSTVARILVGLVRADAGNIQFLDHASAGKTRDEPSRPIQMVFQDSYGSLNPSFTVRETLVEGIRQDHTVPRRMRYSRAAELLDTVHLPAAFLTRYRHELSGGERQRVGIARALSTRPAIVVADEPVSALDVSVQAQILNLLVELREREALSIIFISHDLGVIKYLADHILVMHLGRIVEQGSAQILASPVEPYTQELVAAAAVGDVGIKTEVASSGAKTFAERESFGSHTST